MSEAVAKFGKRKLVFDVDGSQFLPGGTPCTLCLCKQGIDEAPHSFVRVRERLGDHTEQVALLCADCIARAIIQIERCGLWRDMSASVATAVRNVLRRKRRLPGQRP